MDPLEVLEASYERLLNIPVGASLNQELLDSSFRTLALKAHPDSITGSQTQYQLLTKAYNYLKERNGAIREENLKPSHSFFKQITKENLNFQQQNVTRITAKISLKQLLEADQLNKVYQQVVEYPVINKNNHYIVCSTCRGNSTDCLDCAGAGSNQKLQQAQTSSVVLSISPRNLATSYLFPQKGDVNFDGSRDDLIVQIKFLEENWKLEQNQLIKTIPICLSEFFISTKPTLEFILFSEKTVKINREEITKFPHVIKVEEIAPFNYNVFLQLQLVTPYKETHMIRSIFSQLAKM